MRVSLSEFKTNIDHYLELAGKEEIVLTKDGYPYARITPISKSKADCLESLCGVLPSTANEAEAREARIAKYERDF